MDRLWARARSLEGRTLYTPAREDPFEVIEVAEGRLRIRRQTGTEQTISRELIEAGCRHRLEGGEVKGTGLYEAGLVRSKKPRSYLPAIILAITDEYENRP